jgi:two-component system sensor histidine kinase CpxA
MLSEIARNTELRAWLYTTGGGPVGGQFAPAGAEDVVGRAFVDDEAENIPTDGKILLARRIHSDSGKSYVVIWEAPIRFSPSNIRNFASLRFMTLMLTGGLVCLWLTWYITRPIRTLRSATRQLSQGDLTVRVADRPELRRGDELSELAQDFDDMAARIADLLRSEQQLLADISHELRSPLARISLALDLARRRVTHDLPEHQRIEREVHRLNDLIEQLLTLARLQGQPGNSRGEIVDLRDLTNEIAEDARFEAQANHRRVAICNDCEATILGSPSLLRSAIENVVRNAVRHAPENSEVTICMQRVKGTGRVVIEVRDHGPGVPTQALSRLFDPFFRVEEDRDRISGGVGLGLAIVRQAILFHGGNATAENAPEGGLLVRLELPVR